MLISIIIPVYNCEKYIGRAINSIIMQKIDDYEIIIVNDGSTDKSLDICKLYQQQFSNIKIHTQINEGVSVARNKGIKEAEGKYIMFLDADDEYVTNFFDDNLVNELHNGYDILAFSSYESNLKRNRFGIESKFKDDIISECAWAHIGHFGSCIYLKELLQKNNIYFDEGIRSNEDQVFKFKAFYSANKVRLYSKFCYIYNATEGSVMKTLNGVYDIVEAWERVLDWLDKNDLNQYIYHAVSYVQMKIKSRMLLYAKTYIQTGHNKKQLIDELKKRNGYEMLMNIKQQEVLPYLSNDLYLFQYDLDKFIMNSKIEGKKIKYGRILLKIPFVRWLRDIKRYPMTSIEN